MGPLNARKVLRSKVIQKEGRLINASGVIQLCKHKLQQTILPVRYLLVSNISKGGKENCHNWRQVNV